MPSNKFLNLEDDKKQEIIEAAKLEFAAHKYEDASINKIIKNIHMPRGSFYLYFENKQDLYLYLLKTYIREFKAQFIEVLNKNKQDLFKSLIHFYDYIVDNNNCDGNLINNIFINMNSNQVDIAIPELVDSEFDGSIVKNIDLTRYNIKEEEIEILLSIVIPIFFHAVAISLEHPLKKDDIRVHYLKQINIIKRGLERKEIC